MESERTYTHDYQRHGNSGIAASNGTNMVAPLTGFNTIYSIVI